MGKLSTSCTFGKFKSLIRGQSPRSLSSLWPIILLCPHGQFVSGPSLGAHAPLSRDRFQHKGVWWEVTARHGLAATAFWSQRSLSVHVQCLSCPKDSVCVTSWSFTQSVAPFVSAMTIILKCPQEVKSVHCLPCSCFVSILECKLEPTNLLLQIIHKKPDWFKLILRSCSLITRW